MSHKVICVSEIIAVVFMVAIVVRAVSIIGVFTLNPGTAKLHQVQALVAPSPVIRLHK